MNFEQAKEKATMYIALCRKTSFEVYQKLKRLSVDEKIIKEVIEHLTNLGYIDDEEYVNLFIKQSVKMEKLSVYEIKSKLISKGIDKDLAERKVNVLYDTQYEANIVEKLIKGKLANVEEMKRKSYIYRRGFKANGRD